VRVEKPVVAAGHGGNELVRRGVAVKLRRGAALESDLRFLLDVDVADTVALLVEDGEDDLLVVFFPDGSGARAGRPGTRAPRS
jgi:hypothetical protein